MEKETLKRIFEFLEEKEEHNMPFKLKLIFNKPLTEEELNVKGNLNLEKSKITSLPKGLKVGGTLNLFKLKIKSLPEGLKIRGYLDLRFTKVTSLPEGLKVGGDLFLVDTLITSLPKGLEVGRNLYIDDSPLIKYSDEELRDMIKPDGFINGWIQR